MERSVPIMFYPLMGRRSVMVILAPGRNEFVRRRHDADNAFIKLKKRKRIDDPSSFEYWIHRRVVEFHPTLTSKINVKSDSLLKCIKLISLAIEFSLAI